MQTLLEKLELAVRIKRENLHYEVKWWPDLDFVSGIPLARAIAHDCEIRIAPIPLAQDPHGRPLHNPESLTGEDVGAGYRLLLPEELDGRHACEMRVTDGWGSGVFGKSSKWTYRVPLATCPWPEPADKWAKEKAEHAEGAVIERRYPGQEWMMYLEAEPWWKLEGLEFRVQPFWKERIAFAYGKTVECRHLSVGSHWSPIQNPKYVWREDCEYRISP